MNSKKRTTNRLKAINKINNKLIRLSVFRSNKHIMAQLCDDSTGKVLGGVSTIKLKDNKTPTEGAKKVGEEIAKIAKSKKVTKVVFDRSGYKYHGQVKAVAEGARAAGLKL